MSVSCRVYYETNNANNNNTSNCIRWVLALYIIYYYVYYILFQNAEDHMHSIAHTARCIVTLFVDLLARSSVGPACMHSTRSSTAHPFPQLPPFPPPPSRCPAVDGSFRDLAALFLWARDLFQSARPSSCLRHKLRSPQQLWAKGHLLRARKRV